MILELKWNDRKRHLGLPISFTEYSMSKDRVFCERGLFNITEEQIPLYRISDIQLVRKWYQRIFGVGSVIIISNDATSPKMILENIKNPKDVKEQLYSLVEAAKKERRTISTEVLDSQEQE